MPNQEIPNHRKRQHMKYKKRRKEKGTYFVENGDSPFTVRFTPSVEGEKKTEDKEDK